LENFKLLDYLSLIIKMEAEIPEDERHILEEKTGGTK